MIRANLTLAPVGQQGPPTRAAASALWMALRVARGSLLLATRTTCAELDERAKR
ncbi:MAG: hypothetical protein ACE5EC_06845 [Phycisphaerae bacterium]